MPIITPGLRCFSASANLASVGKEGVLVWMMTSSYSAAMSSVCCTESSSAGASSTRLPGTSAAGCASQVGYQNDLISRLAW
ncbi:hypothetical protein D9M69_438550 [compost metagenome]